ncbi:MAG: hypothetical protein JNJ88_09755 [Planctomycetes bacterium]|nr:hypothetical protein [Planctomycetota bacterium]
MSFDLRPLISILDRELGLQRSIASHLDRALDAALTRKLPPLTEALSEVTALAARAQSLSLERDSWIRARLRTAAGVSTPALASIAEIPGAPRAELLALRTSLRETVDAVHMRSHRLSTVTRELGDAYGVVVTAILRASAPQAEPAAAAAGGCLLNVEA